MTDAGLTLEAIAVGLAIVVVLVMAGVGMILASRRNGRDSRSVD